MSSELLDIESDEKGQRLLLSMNAHCYAFLTMLGSQEYSSETYCLPPNEDGWQKAEAIIAALNGWIEHSKRTQCQLP